MDKKTLSGKITFIHHEKKYATIEYTSNGKIKTINGNVNEAEQQKLKEKKLIKRVHAFRIGDEVSFVITLSPRGDRMIASNIEFRFNNAYTNLLHKAKTDNQFVGYLKKVDEQYFVKETGSYILFPLLLSPWEKIPHESKLNEPVFFKLDNIDKPNGITASLHKSHFIPEYTAAQKFCRDKTPVDAHVYKVSKYGIFLHLFNNKIQAKLTVTEGHSIKNGDIIKVIITYISPFKIVVKEAG
ncbi:MAG: hypothetical protein QM791_13805 [Ferruginibacter sp.]